MESQEAVIVSDWPGMVMRLILCPSLEGFDDILVEKTYGCGGGFRFSGNVRSVSVTILIWTGDHRNCIANKVIL